MEYLYRCVGEDVCGERINRTSKSRILNEHLHFVRSFTILVNFYSLYLYRNDDFFLRVKEQRSVCVCWIASSLNASTLVLPFCATIWMIHTETFILAGHRTHCTHVCLYWLIPSSFYSIRFVCCHRMNFIRL